MIRLRALAFALLSLLAPALALAAPTANSFVTPQTPVSGYYQFTSGSSSGAYQTVLTGGTNGTKVFALWAASSDPTSAHSFYCAVFHSTTIYGGASLSIAAATGQTTSYFGTSINLLNPANWPGLPIDSDGNSFLFLASGDTLQCTFGTAAITAGDFISVYAMGSAY